MYNVKIDNDTRDALKRSDTEILKKLLLKGNENVVKDLKVRKGDDIRFLQGVSHVIDKLLEVL